MLFEKLCQNCPENENFKVSRNCSGSSSKKKFGVEIPFLLKTTNKQTNKQTMAGAERRRNCNVAKCGEMCKQNVLIQAEEEEEEESNVGTSIVIVVT
jgi:hypothetical protein